jgi:hypothetical protein
MGKESQHLEQAQGPPPFSPEHVVIVLDIVLAEEVVKLIELRVLLNVQRAPFASLEPGVRWGEQSEGME